MIGVITFAVLSTLLSLVFALACTVARMALPKWCAVPAVIAIWLIWARTLIFLANSVLAP